MSKNKVTIFILVSLVILMFLFNKLLFGDYKFIGPDSLSPAAISQGIELSEETTKRVTPRRRRNFTLSTTSMYRGLGFMVLVLFTS